MRAIDADAMIERLKAWDTNDATDKALYNFALNRILEAPTVEPKRKTGHWISGRDEDGRHMWLICSECRAKETNLKAKYCPVCGRKMA